jgi:hypothetical protein
MKISRLIKAIAIGLIAMTAPAVAGNLSLPYGVAVDASGDLYVVSFFAGAVVRYDRKFASPPTLIKDGLNHPYSIAIDTTGLIYVGNLQGNRITAYAPSGARVPPAEIQSAVSPNSLATGPDHVLYACDGLIVAAYDTVNANALLRQYVLPAVLSGSPVGSDNGLFFFGNFGQVGFMSEPSLWANNPGPTHFYTLGNVAPLGLTFDNFHNGFVITGSRSVVTLNGDVLIQNLPSQPGGIALDKTRNLLFISLPNGNVVQVYTLTYDSFHNPVSASFLKSIT